MAEFKVGDLVRATSDCGIAKAGQEYEVTLGNGQLCIAQRGIPGTTKYIHCSCSNSWKLLSEAKKDMNNFIELSELEKENLSEDAQALRRVGVITPDLRVISSDNLLNRLLKLNFKALAAQAKKEIAAEELLKKESKKD